MRTIWIANPKNIKTIFGSQFENYGRGKTFYNRWYNLLGTGIFNADGREWYNFRHRFRPFFNRQCISNLNSFKKQIQIIINRYFNGGRTVNFKNIISKFAFDAISNYAMGFQVNVLTDRKNNFFDALERIKTI